MKYDVHIESIPPNEAQGPQCLTFGDYKRVIGVAGVQKMVNRFMKCLLTPQGSDVSDSEYGTPLATSFMGNVNPKDIFSMASHAVALAEQKIQEYDSIEGLPDNERLAAAEIENIYVDESGPGVVLVVRLSNVSGTTVQTQVSSYRGLSNG